MNAEQATVRSRLLASYARLDQAATVPSPCVSVCKMELEHNLCRGCLRKIEEIAAWSRMGEADKRTVWHALAERARHGETT